MQLVKRILLLPISVLLFVSGCSMLSPIRTESTSQYVLNATPTLHAKKASRNITLVVMASETNPMFDTKQMAYTTQPYQISYFANNQWAEKPGKMLQTIIIQTLQKTHYFSAVNSLLSLGTNNFILHMQLIELQQDFTHKPSLLRMTLHVQITNSANNQVVATKQFSTTTEIWQDSPYGGVIAANKATALLVKQVTEFCLTTIK
jgi:cholesterol transport system auxiliary component